MSIIFSHVQHLFTLYFLSAADVDCNCTDLKKHRTPPSRHFGKACGRTSFPAVLQALPEMPVTLLRIRGVLLSWEYMLTVLKSGSYDLLLRLRFCRKFFSSSWKVLSYAWVSSAHLCEENKPIYEVSYIHANSMALFQAKYYWNSLFQFFNISPSCQKLLRSFSSISYGPSTLLRHLEGWRREGFRTPFICVVTGSQQLRKNAWTFFVVHIWEEVLSHTSCIPQLGKARSIFFSKVAEVCSRRPSKMDWAQCLC